MSKKIKMTPEAASRIQASTAKQNDGTVAKSSFAARAQSAAAVNTSDVNNAVSKNSK